MNKKRKKERARQGRNIPWPWVHQAIWGEWQKCPPCAWIAKEE